MTADTVSPSALRRATSLDMAIASWQPIPPEQVVAWWDDPEVEVVP